MMAVLHRVIPIFIPQKACPYRCTYCNQFAIAGQSRIPTPEDANRTIQEHLETIPSGANIRIAFFGGSFTGMSIEEQNSYLDIAYPYVQKNVVQSIQLSTRPDYITPEILENLKQHGVSLIELGAQSLHDNILQNVNRGHTVRQVQEASSMIRAHGFDLGLQMMIGLPGDSKELALRTAQQIAGFGAVCTRIYPTLVVQHTPLAHDYLAGNYQPLTLEEAVDWCKDLWLFFQEKNITVLRMGLHPSEGLLSGDDYLAGPFHVSFKELVMTAIWHDRILSQLHGDPNAEALINVPDGQINYAVGYGSANRKAFPNVKFVSCR